MQVHHVTGLREKAERTWAVPECVNPLQSSAQQDLSPLLCCKESRCHGCPPSPPHMSCSSRRCHTSASTGWPGSHPPCAVSQDTALTRAIPVCRPTAPRGSEAAQPKWTEISEPQREAGTLAAVLTVPSGCSLWLPTKGIIPIKLPSLCRRLGK